MRNVNEIEAFGNGETRIFEGCATDSDFALKELVARHGPVFVGVDLHKRSISVCVMGALGGVLERTRGPRDLHQLDRLIRRYRGRVVSLAFEAGPTGYSWAPKLRELGANVVVAAPVHIRKSPKERAVKTDKRDAATIASELRSGQLVSIAELPEQQLEDRELLRTVQQIAEHKRDLIRQIKSKLLVHNIDAPWDEQGAAARGLRKRDLAWLEDAPTGRPALDASLLSLATLFRAFHEQELLLRRRVTDLMKLPRYAETYDRLMRVSGLGPRTAETWVLEAPPASEFTGQKWASWLGLVPGEASSGEKKKGTRTTRMGNRRLRTALIEIAPQLAAGDPALSEHLMKVRQKTGKYQVARVAVARRFAIRMFTAIQRGEDYKPADKEDLPPRPVREA